MASAAEPHQSRAAENVASVILCKGFRMRPSSSRTRLALDVELRGHWYNVVVYCGAAIHKLSEDASEAIDPARLIHAIVARQAGVDLPC